jgi:hypothetical protein
MRQFGPARGANSRARYTLKFDPSRSSHDRRDYRTNVQSQDLTPAIWQGTSGWFPCGWATAACCEIARDGMGNVYEAVEESLGRCG